MSSQANIYIDQGTDFRLTIELFDEDDLDLPINAYTFFSDIRKIYSNKKDVVGVHIKYRKPLNNYIVIKNDFKKKTFNQISKKILQNKIINQYLKSL